MSESIYLHGSEEVGNAGRSIRAAASEISTASSGFSFAATHLTSAIDQMNLAESGREHPSILDLMAMAALSGLLAGKYWDADVVAEEAYRYAEAMMRARATHA